MENQKGILNQNKTKLRILVIDDIKTMCALLDDFLSHEGHVITSVGSGIEAIQLLRSEEYDLILSDLVMSNGTGYDVIKAVNKMEKRPKLGILTGLHENLVHLKEKGLEVDFILRKPFGFSELSRQINEVISNN